MPNETSTQQTGLFHNVFFWLKDGGTDADARALADGCQKHLPRIPGVLRLTVGFPAGTPRSVVDNSYGVALLVEFTNAEACAAYDVHPDHERFVQECSPYWSRVLVYDTLPV